MPELPEVETVRRGLERLLAGRPILAVTALNPKSLPISEEDLDRYVLGAAVVAVRRHAKVLVLDLDSAHSLVAHLKMTGQMVVRDETQQWGAGHPSDSFVGQLPDRSTRVIFDLGPRGTPGTPGTPGTRGRFSCPTLSQGVSARLFFNDQRIFGWIRLVPTPEVADIPFIAALGPEPVGPAGEELGADAARTAAAEFLVRARRRAKSPIKAVILDQTVVGGIGNIYADEALWSAGLHPATRVQEISDDELRTLFHAAAHAMLLSLEAGGSTMATYIHADGSRGDYLERFANVFHRDGRPCPKCGTTIVKTKVAGRGTHLCPQCQQAPD